MTHSHVTIVTIACRFGFMSMQLLSRYSLQDVIDSTNGLDLFRVREICRQILNGLTYLASFGVVHSDLKPSNIMFCRPQGEGIPVDTVPSSSYDSYPRDNDIAFEEGALLMDEDGPLYPVPYASGGMTRTSRFSKLSEAQQMLEVPDAPNPAALAADPTASVRIIDFSNSVEEETESNYYMTSRAYRSPEVLLGGKIVHLSDVWAFGCIAMEMFLGKMLFPGSSEVDQMGRIVETCGLPPAHMTERSERTHNYFVEHEKIGFAHFPLPRGWSIVASKTKPGRHYYVSASATATFSRPAVPPHEIDLIKKRLPAGWSVRESRTKPGNYVYIDTNRPGHSQWTPPRRRPLSIIFAERLHHMVAQKKILSLELFEVVSRALHICPRDRATAADLLRLSFFCEG